MSSSTHFASIPVIDVTALRARTAGQSDVARKIGAACRDHGFFYVSHHGIGLELQDKLESLSKAFFARPEKAKMRIAMSEGGAAWRGYFPVGQELTSGKPDLKEGIYFGTELPATHPSVVAGWPLHGANLFLPEDAEFRTTVLAYIEAVTRLGHDLMRAFALSLSLGENYFSEHYTADPLILFRIFNYPPPASREQHSAWGVGEHTDYGFLTILKQDTCGGLEVHTKSGWVDAPPIPDTFVCNIGDMLDRITGGQYKSTPHRVRNTAGRPRLSFPLFFDPSFPSKVALIPGITKERIIDDKNSRWDKASVHDFAGTYGEYLLRKVGKVFPGLSSAALK